MVDNIYSGIHLCKHSQLREERADSTGRSDVKTGGAEISSVMTHVNAALEKYVIECCSSDDRSVPCSRYQLHPICNLCGMVLLSLRCVWQCISIHNWKETAVPRIIERRCRDQFYRRMPSYAVAVVCFEDTLQTQKKVLPYMWVHIYWDLLSQGRLL